MRAGGAPRRACAESTTNPQVADPIERDRVRHALLTLPDRTAYRARAGILRREDANRDRRRAPTSRSARSRAASSSACASSPRHSNMSLTNTSPISLRCTHSAHSTTTSVRRRGVICSGARVVRAAGAAEARRRADRVNGSATPCAARAAGARRAHRFARESCPIRESIAASGLAYRGACRSAARRLACRRSTSGAENRAMHGAMLAQNAAMERVVAGAAPHRRVSLDARKSAASSHRTRPTARGTLSSFSERRRSRSRVAWMHDGPSLDAWQDGFRAATLRCSIYRRAIAWTELALMDGARIVAQAALSWQKTPPSRQAARSG